MTRFTHPADVNWLIGAPPGYIGHDRMLGFHLELSQQPWSVLVFNGVEHAHPKALEVLAQAFNSGSFTDARERKVYLSDAVVVLTATSEKVLKEKLGFQTKGTELADREPIEIDPSAVLSDDLIPLLDAVWRPRIDSHERVQGWLHDWILPPLTERFSRQGLHLDWEESTIEWLSNEVLASSNLSSAEELIEKVVIPELVPLLDVRADVTISYEDEVFVVADQG
jgi:ATP-dependent Clp protease ATP-binding subunit ClpC